RRTLRPLPRSRSCWAGWRCWPVICRHAKRPRWTPWRRCAMSELITVRTEIYMRTDTFTRSALMALCAGLCLAPSLLLGQQEADPNFKVTVDRPAYVKTHPKVLFDEAHFNFHTAGGRYKPFADLIAHDGYQVTPNKAKFSQKTLEGFDLLI